MQISDTVNVVEYQWQGSYLLVRVYQVLLIQEMQRIEQNLFIIHNTLKHQFTPTKQASHLALVNYCGVLRMFY